MRKLRELEEWLIRAESVLAVALVLVMLVLASYNVVYRNVLVPLQQRWAHSGPPVATEPAAAVDPAPEAKPQGPPDAKPETKAEPASDDFGGFGGGLGDDEPEAKAEPKPETKAEPASDDFGGFGGGFGDDEPETKAEPKPETKAEPASDDFGGFGGGFGDDEPEAKAEPKPEAKAEPKPEPKPEPKAEPASDDFGGFGGGFGDDEPEAKAEPASDAHDDGDDGAEGFGGGFGDDDGKPQGKADAPEDELDDIFGDDDEDPFANLAEIDVAAKKDADDALQGGPPPKGSWQAAAIAFVDAIKLDWIDIFLRQLVIMVSFLGAMLATQRGKHINIDALSKVLPPKAQRVVRVVIPLAAISVCLVFAGAGWDLVTISREYPTELLPWADEWTLQLMFPVGFGLLAVHFGVGLVEALADPPRPPPSRPKAATEPQLLDGDGGDGAESDDDAPDRSTGDDDAAASAASEGGPR
ncbi:TRAP transporter small permease [Paraliomyxa miuraensis]|uniref:TRAP transporter small permease n=1 Tax=Paraliomyxa miuraensis TaxID=376150 RepID=UPI0022508609|nr:TRAP transporter small permease subunit [Paraliomyxa miuraensis]MCX4240978.1 TRAP transporter small permease subunit [Paraliomyxa miuraensis]